MINDSDPHSEPLRPASDIFPAAHNSKAEAIHRPRSSLGLDLAFAVIVGLALLFDVPVMLLESVSPRALSSQCHAGLKCQNFRLMIRLARQRLAAAQEQAVSVQDHQALQASRDNTPLERDPWNTPLKIAFCEQFQDDCVISAGPDRRFETSDDIVLPISAAQF